MNGLFNQSLPSRKELADRYDSSYPTIKKALDSLASKKIIVQFKRTFKKPPLQSKSKNSATIIWLTWGEPTKERGLSPWEQEYNQILEKECSNANIQLSSIRFTAGPHNTVVFLDKQGNSVRDQLSDNAVLGYCVGTIDVSLIDEYFISTKQSVISSFLKTRYFDLSEQFDDLEGPIRQVIRTNILQTRLKPLFTNALKKTEITAWVCCNDSTALLAKTFLNKYTPDSKIQLIGFDDSYEAMRQRLTSFNFNIQALVEAMLSYIVNSSNRKSHIEIEGILIERQSTFPLWIK